MSLIRTSAVRAVWRRQLWSQLGNPLGYVFVLAFVLIYGALLFLPDDFFVRNINDLGSIHALMPWLLAVLIPAISMGSWASERELGTEEQLLTLPLSESDALIGKWLAVSSYFTIALLCSLSNVAVLAWLGDPDLGLVFSQYVGWWILGLAFSAVGVMVSAWVTSPAIAFVFGVVACGALCGAVESAEWLSAFERGLISLGQLSLGLAATALFLGVGVISLSARRWRPTQREAVRSHVLTFAGLIMISINLSVQVDRAALDLDVTEEGLSSLSATSAELLAQQSHPVEITAFVSEELPPELALKGQEVLNFLQLVERAAPQRVKLKVYRPVDSLDEAASVASEHFGLKPHRVVVDSVTGQEEREVFLAAVVTSGVRTEKITHFSPGLSVEYELVRAVRSASTVKKQVIGVAKTEINMLGGIDYATRQLARPWEVIEELKKQYEVREVNLDVPVAEDVTVLIAPQPSGLTQAQLEVLHDYIWAGRPALILEDPMPMFSGPQLGSSQPRAPSQQMMMMGQRAQPDPKPDLKPLLSALGIEMPLDGVVWSDFNPSHQFRNVWPRDLVWSLKSKGGVGEASFLGGVNSLLFPWPGEVKRAASAPEDLKITPIASPVRGSVWGRHAYNEFFTQGMFGGRQMTTPQRHLPVAGERPYLAVEITGSMRRAYGDEPQEDGSKKSDTAEKPAQADASEKTRGAISAQPIRVMFVADLDFAHDEFFAFYRNADNRFSDEQIKFLAELRNVQFISNMIDALAGEQHYLQLRARYPKARPLTALVEVLNQAQQAFRSAENQAQRDAEGSIKKLRDDFQTRLNAIQSEEGLDENAKEQLRAQVQRAAQRQLDQDIVRVERERDLAIRRANITRAREVEAVRGQVRALALGIPTIILALIAQLVWTRRRRDESLTIPSARQRGNA